MADYLLKTEPSTYSFADLQKDKATEWDGVSNPVALRNLRGMKKGDLSKFIEDAVKWRVLDQTMAEARGKFSDLAPDALDSLLQEAVTATREAATKNAD